MSKIRLIRPRGHTIQRAFVELGFILFLFYANLLMGEFNRSSRADKTLLFALNDIFTPKNFCIGLFSAMVGYVVFEHLRKQA